MPVSGSFSTMSYKSAARLVAKEGRSVSDAVVVGEDGLVDVRLDMDATSLRAKAGKPCRVRCVVVDGAVDKPVELAGKALYADVLSVADAAGMLSVHVLADAPAFAGRTVRVSCGRAPSKAPRVGAGVCLVAAVALAVVAVLNPWGDPRARRGYYDGKTKEEIQADLDEQVAWYSMEISIASYMEVRESETEVEARIENVEANHCDQKVMLYEAGHPDDVLYESGAIAPGEYIQDIELAHPLEPGRHDIVAVFQGYEQNLSLISDEGQILGHDTFGASCSAEVVLYVVPKGVPMTLEKEAAKEREAKEAEKADASGTSAEQSSESPVDR